MQKQFLAAVVASVVAGQAMAVTIVDDGTNKFTLGGHIGIRAVAGKTGDAASSLQSAGDSSRFNFQFESKLNEDITAFARGEWGFDVTRQGDGQFNNRLGFVGATTDYGSLSVGKQWSSFSQIANWTDTFATSDGGMGMYGSNGHAYGTARANDSLQYNLSVDALSVSAQYQAGEAIDGKNGQYTRKHGYGFAASYELPMGVSLGAAYNQVQFVENVNDAKALVLAAKFEQGPIYAAFTYGDYKNHASIGSGVNGKTIEKARGIELVGGYQLADNLSVQTGFMQLKDKDDSNFKDQFVPVEVMYTAGPVQLSGTYNFQQSKHNGVDVKDSVVAQARYYF